MGFYDCIKNNKLTINSINKKSNCFQYTVTVALNHEEIRKTLWKNNKNQGFYQQKIYLKNRIGKGEKNNLTIALNVLHAKKEKKYLAYV